MKKILLIIIVLSCISSQGVFAENFQNQDWVLYTSPMNDYILKHPQDWIASSLGKFYVTLNSPSNKEIKQKKKDEKTTGKGYMDDITIAYYSSGKNFAGYPTFKDWLQDKNNPNRYISNVEKIELSGLEAWEMIMTGSRTGYIIMVEHNGHLYQIGFNNRSDKTKLTYIDKKIIKSFKFID
jgi:hypothetical protein